MISSFKTGLKRRGILFAAAALVMAPWLSPMSAQAATVEEVKAKGKIVVGIQGDNAPWGFVNSSGVLCASVYSLLRGAKARRSPRSTPASMQAASPTRSARASRKAAGAWPTS